MTDLRASDRRKSVSVRGLQPAKARFAGTVRRDTGAMLANRTSVRVLPIRATETAPGLSDLYADRALRWGLAGLELWAEAAAGLADYFAAEARAV